MSDKKIKILFPHQTDFLNYSQKECYNKDGFLLFHSYGEGKTITSLSWAMNYPNKKINIIIPKIIKEQWENEISKIVPKKNVKNIKFIEYKKFLQNPENFSNQLKENLLIFDEAHNICEYFNNSDDNQNLTQIIDILKYPSKLLLLSATPIIDSILDLSLLVNICAKKKTMNISKKAFYEKYGNINEERRKKINSQYSIFRSSNTRIFKSIIIEITQIIAAFIISQIISGTMLKYGKIRDKSYIKTKSKDSDGKDLYIKKDRTYSQPNPGTGVDLGVYNWFGRDVKLKGDTSTNRKEMSFFEWEVLFFIYFLVKFSQRLVKIPIGKFMETESDKLSKLDIYEFYDLNYDKIIKDSFKYVNIHSNFVKYPNNRYSEIIYLHEYSVHQNMVIMDLIFEQPINQTYKLLQMYNENSYKQENITYYKDGIKASNLNKFIFEIILENIKVTQKKYFGFFIDSSYNDKFNLNDIDSKIKLIISKYRKKKEKTVIYSNFWKQGIKNISIILNYFNINHYILDSNFSNQMKMNLINNFNNDSSINLLLIDSKNLQGLNLKEIKTLHILEPIKSYFKRKELLNIFTNNKTKMVINSHIFNQVQIIHTQKDDFKLQIEKLYKNYEKKLNLEINDKFLLKSRELKKKNSKKKIVIMEWISKFGGLLDNLYQFLKKGDIFAIQRIKKQLVQQNFEYDANNKNSKNNVIITYIKNKFKSNNKKDITNIYNLMAYVEKNRSKLNINIEENIYLSYLKEKKKISKIYDEIHKNSNKFEKDKECKQRRCSIWTPNNEGTCKDLN